MKKIGNRVVYSPTDLAGYFASPYRSWMDRYHLENPGELTADAMGDDQRLVIETGRVHEREVLLGLRDEIDGIAEIAWEDPDPFATTLDAIRAGVPVIYQAALTDDVFEGYADFVMVNREGQYQVWDTKLARSPKPNYVIQLCCYSEMLAAVTGMAMPERFGIILGSKERVEFRVEDFIHFYRHIRASFLAMHERFSVDLRDCPEPAARVDHGRWGSHAESFFSDSDHLVRVAGISGGQIKKLKKAGITTAADLAQCNGLVVPRLAADSLAKLSAQARLQHETRADRLVNPEAKPRFEILTNTDPNAPVGIAALPAPDAADVFFDMEGYPLVPGGLEYLFGACTVDEATGRLVFHDWWAHNRAEEKLAFEGFIDWVHGRWRQNQAMHIYHYAPYEVTAVKRLSTFHDTRQDEVDDLLRAGVFVDLYKIVRQGIRLGEKSYSIKKVERLYREARSTDVATGGESIVQYAKWTDSGESGDWHDSSILREIRDYNEDDCSSTHGLYQWLRGVADANGIPPLRPVMDLAEGEAPLIQKPETARRAKIVEQLRAKGDDVSKVLGDIVDFHRREAKPLWWRMFERAGASPEELCDDPSCIQGVRAVGLPADDRRSLVQEYRFDPEQECKLTAGERKYVMFCHNIAAKFALVELDILAGTLKLKIGKSSLDKYFAGVFPETGSLLPDEYVPPEPIPAALSDIGERHLSGNLPRSAMALLTRRPPATLGNPNAAATGRAIEITRSMSGDCLVVQGPPGTGKTYTAARVINSLVAAGKKVGISSNSHKAVDNLLIECGKAARLAGGTMRGLKVGGDASGPLFEANREFYHVRSSSDAQEAYYDGIIGGTAWLFCRPDWIDQLDYLFIDEAGQVCLANTIAMSRCAKNLVLLGDQMQLEQPVQGAHPGDAGLSGLQYALKDPVASEPDVPVFHAVVPDDYGLFLGESRRMHPDVCSFISDSIYEGRLHSFADCCKQFIALPPGDRHSVGRTSGIVFCGVEHDGNVQQSDEEIGRIREIFGELIGRQFTTQQGDVRPLTLDDFLFISPYNAQVRALQAVLPDGARVGSVDRFQGQEAPVCILSLCSSFGEYGSRGLGFILDQNRINVAISRAQCLAVVVADPRIADTRAGSISEMKLLNLFCKLTALGR